MTLGRARIGGTAARSVIPAFLGRCARRRGPAAAAHRRPARLAPAPTLSPPRPWDAIAGLLRECACCWPPPMPLDVGAHRPPPSVWLAFPRVWRPPPDEQWLRWRCLRDWAVGQRPWLLLDQGGLWDGIYYPVGPPFTGIIISPSLNPRLGVMARVVVLIMVLVAGCGWAGRCCWSAQLFHYRVSGRGRLAGTTSYTPVNTLGMPPERSRSRSSIAAAQVLEG